MLKLRQLLQTYRQQKKALPSFNIDTHIVYQAVCKAVAKTQLPCIVQLSAGEDDFFKAENLWLLVQKAQSDGLPIYCNMDHGKDIQRLKKMIQLGFDMVHFDGSNLPFDQNIIEASQLHKFIASAFPDESTRPLLEVEFNKISLVGSLPDPSGFTTPGEAQKFMNFSKADLLAVSIGNLHGVPQSGIENIQTELFSQITSALPASTLYTMHGGSGIDSTQLNSTISLGVVKVNVNTDLRLAYRSSLKASLSNLDTEKMYDYYKPVIEDIANIAVNKLIQFQNN